MITMIPQFPGFRAACERMWSQQRERVQKSERYGHVADPCHGCQWPLKGRTNATIQYPFTVQQLDDAQSAKVNRIIKDAQSAEVNTIIKDQCELRARIEASLAPANYKMNWQDHGC